MDHLNQYINAFSKLRRGPSKDYGIAPHKPVLLLTLIELVEKGIVSDNRFDMSGMLVELFEENWRLLVQTQHRMDIKQPFYYLQSDKVGGYSFWNLKSRSGTAITTKFTSLFNLIETVDYGEFSPTLWHLLVNPVEREILKNSLLTNYFPAQAVHFNLSKLNQPMENELGFREPVKNPKHISKQMEKDIFVRSSLFKYYISELYEDTCAMSRMRVDSGNAAYFTEACHIVPFSETQDDHPHNGIALCPNLHWAFDRGLVTVDEKYRIVVSSQITEAIDHPYNLSKLHGNKILLPKQKEYYPAHANFLTHREEVFRG